MASGNAEMALPVPPELLLQVEQEIAKLILANAQVLAKGCAEVCVQQVWAAATATPRAAQQPSAARSPTEGTGAAWPPILEATMAMEERWQRRLLEANVATGAEVPAPPKAQAGPPLSLPGSDPRAKADLAAELEPSKAIEATFSEAQEVVNAEAAPSELPKETQAVAEPTEDPWGFFLEADAASDAKVKGKTKGKGKGPPMPSAKASRAPPAPKAPQELARRNSGMTELKARVEAEGQRKDREEAKEISDLDPSKLHSDVPCERVTCGRCEQDVPKEHFESHMTAHSSEILPWLFLGGKRNLENDKELTVRTQITHVLNLAQEVNLKEDIRTLSTEYQAQRGLEFVYKKVGLGDTPDEDILRDMDDILDFIHQAHSSSPQHRVLVNCVQGISRSSAAVLAYLMKFEKMSLRDAYHFLRHRRSIADPRKEFLQQLGKLECQLFNLSAPTLSSDLAFAGRHMLNLDDAPMPVPQKDVRDPEMRHELEALQKVLQNLNHAVQSIGVEAEAAAEAVRAMGKDAGVPADESIANAAKRYSSNPRTLEAPGLNSEQEACEALVDYMRHAAALMLEQRDHCRRLAEEEDSRTLHQQGSPAPVRPIV